MGRRTGAVLALGVAAVLVETLLVAPQAHAASGDVGHQGGSYAGAGALTFESPTADKPQSKLWFNDGIWWADMFDPGSGTWHIFKLDRTTQKWSDTGTKIDDRPDTRADALWDGKHLYVASNVVAASSASNASGKPSRLFRYSYDAAKDTYTLDKGFPASINDVSSESIAIDKDSKGVLWATWTQDKKVYVNSTSGSDSSWGTPYALAVPGATGLSSDDVSSIAAYGGSKIGVMWSNQTTANFYFATHADGGGPSSWSGQPVGGPDTADDHLSLHQFQGDKSGRLFAAVKTSNDLSGAQDAVQISLLSFTPGSNAWQVTPFGTVGDCHTRPVVMIDATNQVLHMFATAPSTGSGCPHAGTPGTIYEKTTPLSKLSFAPGRGTPVLRDEGSASMNDVTSTKQTITSATGLVIVASNTGTQRYWSVEIPIPGVKVVAPAARPSVAFRATPASRRAFRTIRFASVSKGGVVRWSWNFGDRKSASGKKAVSHTYAKPGRYRVVLTGWTAKGVRVTSTRIIIVRKR